MGHNNIESFSVKIESCKVYNKSCEQIYVTEFISYFSPGKKSDPLWLSCKR